jgi:hypothetical protein
MMSFGFVFHKTTGQIFRCGEVEDQVLAPDEDRVLFDGWVQYTDKAVDPVNRVLVPANDDNGFSYRPSMADAWFPIRETRDTLLTQTDYLMVSDFPMTDEHRAAVKAYRQELRDLTKNFALASEVVFPTLPAFK